MPQLLQSSVRNVLLSALSPDDFALLQQHLKPVTLEVREVLVEPNVPIEHVHFMEAGIASVVAISPGGQRIEIGNIGREGMAGTAVILGVDRAPILTFIQVAGPALRMPASALQQAMEASASLRGLLSRYVHTVTVQTAYTALANGRYTINERLARWLLMSHDRVRSDELPLTHEFLALMLGVRRAGVTDHLHILEGMRIIKSTRGHIRILDRPRLEELAGDSYGLPEAEYARLIESASGEAGQTIDGLWSQAATSQINR
jgi:CRP-like cAMP-binding protein